MLCGTGSFKHLDDNSVADDSPRPRRRRHGGDRASNPFAERGLDKFSTVRSELESRRDKILRRVGSDSGLVMVRFVQCNGRWAPIVVKLPDEQQLKDAAASKKVTRTSTAASPSSTRPAAWSCSLPDTASKNAAARGMEPARRRTASFSRRRLPPPTCYWLAVMVLTLLSLAVFGRAFAICCTSIAWYLVPTLTDIRTPMAMEKPTKPHHEVLSSPKSHAKRSK